MLACAAISYAGLCLAWSWLACTSDWLGLPAHLATCLCQSWPVFAWHTLPSHPNKIGCAPEVQTDCRGNHSQYCFSTFRRLLTSNDPLKSMLIFHCTCICIRSTEGLAGRPAGGGWLEHNKKKSLLEKKNLDWKQGFDEKDDLASKRWLWLQEKLWIKTLSGMNGTLGFQKPILTGKGVRFK